MEQFNRTISLLGQEKFDKLQKATVIIIGTGGVGSPAIEALARTGIGNFILIDSDDYDLTNINRQWPANIKTVGKQKVEVLKQEIRLINPSASITTLPIRLTKESIYEVFDLDKLTAKYSLENLYIIEAIDDIWVKIRLIAHFHENNLKFISSMGAANTFDINKIHLADFSKTTHCKLAKIIKKELKRYNIRGGFPVVYSDEVRKEFPKGVKGSIMPITATFGLKLAWWVIDSIS